MLDSKATWLGGALVVAVLVLVCGWLLLRGYGEVSEHGYEHAMALFSACNRRDTPQVVRIQEMIAQSLDEGRLRADEANWLQGIVTLALDERWDRASSRLRQLMEDQIQRAPPLPEI